MRCGWSTTNSVIPTRSISKLGIRKASIGKTMIRKGPFLLLIFALVACESQYGWNKEGAGSGEIDMARQDCVRESQGYDFLDAPFESQHIMTSHGERFSSINANGAARQADIFNDCMQAKGFSLGPDQDP